MLPRLTLPKGVHLLQKHHGCQFFVCLRWLTHSYCCSPKLKVNSTYWPHRERPFTCVSKPSGADTVANWDSNHTSFVERRGGWDVFGGQSRCQAYSFSPRLLMRWQMGLRPLCAFSPPLYVCVWWEGWHLFVSRRSENMRGLPWIQSALLERSFEWLRWKVYEVPLYLALKHFPALDYII